MIRSSPSQTKLIARRPKELDTNPNAFMSSQHSDPGDLNIRVVIGFVAVLLFGVVLVLFAIYSGWCDSLIQPILPPR